MDDQMQVEQSGIVDNEQMDYYLPSINDSIYVETDANTQALNNNNQIDGVYYTQDINFDNLDSGMMDGLIYSLEQLQYMKYQEISSILCSIRVEMSNIRNKHSSTLTALHNLEVIKANLDEKCEKLEQEIKLLNERITDLEKDLQQVDQDNFDKRKEITRLTRVIDNLDARHNNHVQEIEQQMNLPLDDFDDLAKFLEVNFEGSNS